jgi:predicted RNA-binding Zn-ribbon protein involved in translation (DUF1610 family)
MMPVMDLSQYFGPFTLLQWLFVAGGAMVAMNVMGYVARTRRANEANDKAVPARCLSCHWEGKVSKYHRTCPKCGMNITKLSRNGP